ncbi:MAG: cupin domain-containing protein [Gammaproteobacteria bacterium]
MPDRPRDILGGISTAEFLSRYWQKQPCLIRNAFPGFRSFIDARGLMNLACREDVESRLVLEKDGDYPWQVLHGPFQRRQFVKLPDSRWTLLVQNVDIHLDEARDLLDCFAFVPGWRIDDLMVSFAAPAGGVGPHLDSYDVFLLQAEGERRWCINQSSYTEADFVPDRDLRIIADFRSDAEWVLKTGDMLYLPPGVAHLGTAPGECITYSIGFRAPSRLELLGRFVDDGGAQDQRYSDAGMTPATNPGEITAQALGRIREMMRSAIAADEPINAWFGRHVTQIPERIDVVRPRKPLTPEEFLIEWRAHGKAWRSRRCRAAFIRGPGSALTLFVNGQSFLLPAAAEQFVLHLTGGGVIAAAENVEETTLQVICDLYNEGAVIFR